MARSESERVDEASNPEPSVLEIQRSDDATAGDDSGLREPPDACLWQRCEVEAALRVLRAALAGEVDAEDAAAAAVRRLERARREPVIRVQAD